jgi:uncharacterized damage-inducible protein DinB
LERIYYNIVAPERMIMIQQFKDLMFYQEWADAVFLKIWERTPNAIDDSEMLKRWEHVVLVQNAFHDVLRNNETQLPKSDRPLPGLVELKTFCKNNHEQLKKLISELNQSDLERAVEIRWFPDRPAVLTPAEALMQVLLHTQHHRAQNLTRLQALGGKRIVIDWISWIWKGKPEAQWS